MSSKMVELNLNPDERTLKQFGFIALGGFGLLAACAFFEKFMFAHGLGGARTAVAAGLAALGVVAALCSLVAPKANKLIYIAITVLAYPIGFVMSYVILGSLFFFIFAPVGALLRASGNDPMQRALRKDGQSYWSEARPPRSKESYFRQF
jgi:hypothetical protein